MASLQPLLQHIYHEKQQPGSMLCAQHALNNLLQGNYFTAPDLSSIARELDELEQSYDDNVGSTSTNMDDTGFFSVQVLHNALKVWGLNLIRWRSEVMRPYQGHPEKQLAFILNLEQHWFTLRRFGQAAPDIDQDTGNGHWFNLNSFLSTPERVGKLYLGMVLQQAEAEGYSVFCVTQADPELPLALPRTQADLIASTLPDITSTSSSRLATSRVMPASGSTLPVAHSEEDEYFGDEDFELQAALQASLMADSGSPSPGIGPSQRSSAVSPLEAPRMPSVPLPDHADVDPVTASMERNRVVLQRMREEQEYAQRELFSEEDLSPEDLLALEERRARRLREEQEEADELQRAIAESEALAREEEERRNSGLQEQRAPTPPPSHSLHDDEDSELQAALKASLESHQAQSPGGLSADDSYMSDSIASLDETPAAAPTIDDVRRARLARFGL